MKSTCFCTAVVLAAAVFAQADVLELKNGKVLNGKYVGGTAGTIRFQTSDGIQAIETSQALALTFTTSAAATPAQPASPGTPATTATPVSLSSSVAIPAGTTLLVRMLDGASSNDQKGKRFTTTLEGDLVVQGRLVAKAGTRIYGRVENAERAGRFAGKSVLDLRLTELTLGASFVPLVTGPYAQAGSGSMRKTAGGAAAGAAIGAIAGGGEGAGKGAAIGAVASGLKKGEAVVVPAGTLLEFQLQQPVNINVGA